MSQARPRSVLPAIVLAQLAGTSLWFAGNAVLGELQAALGADGLLGLVTSAVQAGFIAGTLLSALTGLADRASPRRLFLASALLGAGANLLLLVAPSVAAVGAARFLTGVCLAGVYPIGMKIAAGWYRDGLGWALGALVGALVLGTAAPHALRAAGATLPWQSVIVGTSLLAAAGGALLYVVVPDGPHLQRGARFSLADVGRVFAVPGLRRAALGYWGHMWELYTVWSFIPVFLAAHPSAPPVAAGSAAVIGVGALGCVGGGLLTARLGSAAVARALLLVSGLCCLLFPWASQAPGWLFGAYLLVWGVAVVGDSPQLSTLTARAAPPALLGTGLTLVTCVGFALTILSVSVTEAIGDLRVAVPALAIGPALGLWGMRASAGAERSLHIP